MRRPQLIVIPIFARISICCASLTDQVKNDGDLTSNNFRIMWIVAYLLDPTALFFFKMTFLPLNCILQTMLYLLFRVGSLY